MSRIQWVIAAALTIIVAAPATSQQPVMDPSRADARTIHEEATGILGNPGGLLQPSGVSATGFELPSTYWLGIYCSPVPPALRSHVKLPEGQGLLAVQITVNSPAAKAGIAQYDVLLRAGGKPLVEPRDLLAAVEAAKETKLKIDLIRGGKPRTIEVTPAKRPAGQAVGPPLVPDQADWSTIENWLENMTGQGKQGPQPPAQFRIVHPGAILPKDLLGQKSLPMNMSVSITKEGGQPAKINVQRGNDKWENLTEKDLDKLPADVRPFVEQMLGHGMVGVVGGAAPPGMSGGFSSSGGTFQFSMPPATIPQGGLLPGNPDQQTFEKRFDEINRRMDRLFQMMEQLSQGHGPDAGAAVQPSPPHDGQHAAPSPQNKK